MDADYYAPTLRQYDFASPEENEYLIMTPNSNKPESLTDDVFSRLAHTIHDFIENKGVIIIDGIGKFTKNRFNQLLESLIKRLQDYFNVNIYKKARE